MNTKISNEAKLVRLDDVLTRWIWTRYFLKEHGYEIHDKVIYQDNYSVIKLEKNVRRLSSKRTIHISIIYYFLTDMITKQEASVEFCLTLEKIRDYFTKALQRSQFCHFRNIIIGVHEDDITSYSAFGSLFIEELKIKPER